MFVPSVHEA